MRVEEARMVGYAIKEAFFANTDEKFEHLLNLTGMATSGDGRSGAPCINVQERDSGTG